MSYQEEESSWPKDRIETVGCCPVCGSEESEELYTELEDKIFFCAPGKWVLRQCSKCESGYIDPRPNVESIGLAYESYFTHYKTPDFKDLGKLEKIRRIISNGYRNFKYGTKDSPSIMLGILVAYLMPLGRAVIDAGMRHLPKVKGSQRLLDLGCGNGEFLLRARSAGWDVVGLDFDNKAVEAACNQGLDVRLGGIEELDPANEQFDVITMAHVIEHVHDPVSVMQACFALLKKGGVLWIETPNLKSEGHKLFKDSWRGLEPPRHLVIFTLQSMVNALKGVGFSKVEILPYRRLCREMFIASEAISKGLDPYGAKQNISTTLLKNSEKVARLKPEKREHISVKAWKK